LGVILGRYKRLKEIGGTVQIIGVNEQIEKILELSGLSRIMDIRKQADKVFRGTSY
jgi:stage II sporulation protein AA (anti-sigma F factor antagonist)